MNPVETWERPGFVVKNLLYNKGCSVRTTKFMVVGILGLIYTMDLPTKQTVCPLPGFTGEQG